LDLARAFPDFDDRRIVFRDDGLLVVDKPAGVPSQASDPEVPDDLPSRLRAYASYLGTHQRLDAETSGLVLFTTDKAANGPIATQFEKRKVKKTYLACVTGWPRSQRQRTLRHMLDGKEAVTHVRLVEMRGERALLELELETGRTHQARVQLSRARAPIAGDTLYGGVAAPRLMLHAAALDIVSPSGKKLSLSTKMPEMMRAFFERGAREADLASALALAFERRWGLLRAMPPERATTVFRLADDEGDALPGMTIDFYAGYAVVSFLVDGSAEGGTSRTRTVDGSAAGGTSRARTVSPDASWRERVLDTVAHFGFDGVYEKSRPRVASGLSDSARGALAPTLPSRGSPAPSPLPVMEEGTPFLVRLDAGLATGFYADQRRNRVRVMQASRGKRVLNLFSYTCAFSVAAARAGATHTVSVDASASALEKGRESFVHAGLSLDGHEFVAMDARAFLERAARKGERFDLVVLDPPSFGRAKGGSFSIASDFGPLCKLAFDVLEPSAGELLASINHQKTTQDRFRHLVQDAANASGKRVKVRDLPPPLDFPSARLRAVWSTSLKV
jgi:23S rRNA (cytosine1962-C5)-methyltransferase